MKDSPLVKIFRELGQGAKGSVQDGDALGTIDKYLHVKRPVDDILRQKMHEIDVAGGGLVLLAGSAGDGKSHLISCIKSEDSFRDFSYYNDATESYSPTVTATQTLEKGLSQFKDYNIASTSAKMLLAINLGKLNEFIEADSVRKEYGELTDVAKQIFDDDAIGNNYDTDRIKVVLFTNQQIYEIKKKSVEDYPVDSQFLRSILQRITQKSDNNPFYKAYEKTASQCGDTIDSAVVNYELLSIPAFQDTIVKMCIEAIIRFQLMLTPRDFLDFIYKIVVYEHNGEYDISKDFFPSLLPTLIYSNGDNRILQSLYLLDPLKYSNNGHDNDLALLFTAAKIPDAYFSEADLSAMPGKMIDKANQFYSNGEKNITDLSEFLLRLKHLKHYHSESAAYKDFLQLYMRFINGDTKAYIEAYSLVGHSIIRHYGSYYDKDNLVPLNIQGSTYRLFAPLSMKNQMPVVHYENENMFRPYITLQWKVKNHEEPISLTLDYDLYCYLTDLQDGMLNVNYENDKNMKFNTFINQLIDKSDKTTEVIILDDNNNKEELKYDFDVLTISK